MRGVDFCVQRGRGLRPARPQRRRQDDHGRDPRGPPGAHLRPRSPCSATTRGERAGALRERVGIVLQSCGVYPHLTVRESVAHFAALYAAPRDVDEVLDAGRARQPGRHTGPDPLGRAAAAAGLRAGAGRRPRARLPRRADDRLRPRGAPAGVGDGALAARPRQDRPAHHALPRRGAGPRRPRGDHPRRRDPRRGRAGRPRRREPKPATGSPTAAAASGCRRRPPTRPRGCTSSPVQRWRVVRSSRGSP